MEAAEPVPTESKPKPKPPPVSSGITVGDLILWRRKKLSSLILLGSTAIWVLLEFSRFKFVTLASWATMFVLTCLFFYGNLVRLIRKEEPNMSAFEISEEATSKIADSIRQAVDDASRWVLRMSAGADWFTFAKTVAFLWVLSYVGKLLDFITLLYLGMVLGLTVPSLYMKNENKIKTWEEKMKMQVGRAYGIVDEKVLMKIKSMVMHTVDEKEKKTE